MGKKKNFVMVAGNPRSGTTFVGKMLAIPRDVMYLAEPFNVDKGLVAGVEHQFPYISETSKDVLSLNHKKAVDEFINGESKLTNEKNSSEEPKSAKRLFGEAVFGTRNNYEYKMLHMNPLIKTGIIKDPTASLLANYVHNVHDIPVVIVLRHPGAVVASFKKLNINHEVSKLLNQPALKADYLGTLLKNVNYKNFDLIEQAAWHWNCINHILLDFAKKNKKMIVVRHEDLSQNPIEEFRKLYEKLGLHFSDRVERIIAEHTAAHNPVAAAEGEWHQLKRNSRENIHRWHKVLSDKETEIVRAITAKIADEFYVKSTWQPQYVPVR